MEFSNLFFLYFFFPLCTGLYFLAPGMKLKNGILILFGFLYYCFCQPIYVPLVLILSVLNYWLPKIICRRKLAVILSVFLNIGTLTFFKLCGNLLFPLGLSFYVFSLIAYQVDLYGKGEECHNFSQFLLFVMFFPKLIMGPIVRYSQIAPQLQEREIDPASIFKGCFRFAVGLGKKILLADPLFRVYEQLGTHSSWLSVWGGGLAFMLYIYLEFSGYCDMTLGMGRVFGFSLPENFNKPYTAISVGEFWRRWHMTLGSFFRDYVYIPLGGNRKGVFRQICNLLVVWILTGLWHGMSVTFLLWGIYFFVLLSGEKLLFRFISKVPSVLRWLVSVLFIYFGWIIFAAKNLSSLWNSVCRMISFSGTGMEPTFLVLRNSLPLFAVSIFCAIIGPVWIGKWKSRGENRSNISQRLIVIVQGVLILLLLAVCTVSIIGNGARPSMYANF